MSTHADTDASTGTAAREVAHPSPPPGHRSRRRHRRLHADLGRAAADHRLAQREPAPPRGVRRHPRPAEAGLLHDHPGDARLGGVPVRRPDEELGARQAGPDAAAPRRRTPSGASPTSAPASTCARCCATRPPASCTR